MIIFEASYMAIYSEERAKIVPSFDTDMHDPDLEFKWIEIPYFDLRSRCDA